MTTLVGLDRLSSNALVPWDRHGTMKSIRRETMIFHLGIENNNDDRTIAWALDHPGCFAYGENSEEAQTNFLQAAQEYRAWIARQEEPWLDEDVEVVVEETFDVYFLNPSFE